MRTILSAVLQVTVLWTCSLPGQTTPSSNSNTADSEVEARTVERGRHRITYIGGSRKQPSPGQISFEVGRLRWQDKPLDDGVWAAGLDFWSTMDITAPIDFGGTAIAPGHYYLALERNGAKHTLLVLDADKARKAHVAFPPSAPMRGARKVPLTQHAVKGKPRHLSMTTRVVNRVKAPEKLEFSLQWGPHAYRAPIKMKNLGKVSLFIDTGTRSRCLVHSGAEDVAQTLATIEHARPKWRQELAKLQSAMKPKSRWRLGQNFWSSLETTVPITIGKTRLKPGHWFLMLQRQKGDAWALVTLPSKKAYKQAVDAFQVAGVKTGTVIPLATEASGPKRQESEQEELSIALVPQPGLTAQLEIRWGPALLTAPVQFHLR